jgi:TorA maturation chaperone TorD
MAGESRPVRAGLLTTLYSLCAHGLNYPDEALASTLKEGEFESTLRQALAGLGRSEPDILRELSGHYGNTVLTPEALLLELERDYTWMFFASKPRVAYLFESVYSEGRLYQESTFQIARLYHAAGLKIEEAFKLPPDHIAVELEFMAYLAFQEMEGLRAGEAERADYARDMQKTVRESHLGPFALELALRVEKNAKTVFYRTVARTLKAVFNSDL